MKIFSSTISIITAVITQNVYDYGQDKYQQFRRHERYFKHLSVEKYNIIDDQNIMKTNVMKSENYRFISKIDVTKLYVFASRANLIRNMVCNYNTIYIMFETLYLCVNK